MSTNNIKTPVGLETVVGAVQEICDQAQIYHRCGLKPPHFIINLDSGNGQTTLTEYIAEMYYEAGVRHFREPDLFLEYVVDGSMVQLKRVFADIMNCAVYTNEYEGVISMDITKLANHINEAQTEFFISKVAETSVDATMIFYVPSHMNRNMASLIEKIRNAVDDVEFMRVGAYSNAQLTSIAKNIIEEAGILIKESDDLDKQLDDIILAEEITTVKKMKKFSQILIKYADFKGFVPLLDAECIKHALRSENVKEEGEGYEK